MKPRTILLLLLSGVWQLQAQQSPEKRIPKKSTLVLSLNLNSLSNKMNFNDLGNINFLKKPENLENFEPSEVLRELFRLPDKATISRTGKLFIFSENHDSIKNLSYLMPITDAGAFEKRITDIIKIRQNDVKFKKEGKLKVLNYERRMCISVSKDYAIITLWKAPYYYNEDYDQYNEERNKVVEMIDSIKYGYEGVPADTASVEDGEVTADTTISEEETPPAEPDDYDSYYAVDTAVAMVETYDDGYENDSLMKQFERRWALKRKGDEERFFEKHNRKMTLHHKKINELKPNESIASNINFAKVFSNNDDIIYWFDYQSYSEQLIDLMSDKYGYTYRNDTAFNKEKFKNRPPDQLAELINGNLMYGLGNFEKGEIKINFYNTFNEKLKPYIGNIYSKNINPLFFKYIKNDNLMGLIGMSVNTQAGADLYYEILRRASESSAIPNKWILAYLEMTDIFLDKNALHHTLKGDAVIAFTGIKSYLKTYTDYQFDSLTFESKAVEKTSTKYVPEFVSIFTIENLNNVKRIIKLIKRLDGLTEVAKDIYSFKSRSTEIDGQFFVVIKDSLLFITNDKPLATEQINQGLSDSKTVGNQYDSYLKNPGFGFWDASKMFKLMAEEPDEKFGKTDILQKLSQKINKGFFISKPLENNSMNSEITFELKNRENSSLLELLKLFDDLYIMQKF